MARFIMPVSDSVPPLESTFAVGKTLQTDARLHFLENAWSPYPVRPTHHNVAFRVAKVAPHWITSTSGGDYTFAPPKLDGTPTPAPPWLKIWSKILTSGDWISAHQEHGVLTEICLLAPCLKPPSESRIVGDVWRRHQQFQIFLGWVREFFAAAKFSEVSTPTLVDCPGTEPSLDPFSTEFIDGNRRQTFFLPTSPEIHLKKVIAETGKPVFEICKAFRNGEITELHQPEFWMLEWYRPFETLDAIKKDVIDLIQFLQKKCELPQNTSVSSRSLHSLFKEFLDFELKPESTLEDLQSLLPSLQLGGDVRRYTFDDLFFVLLIEKIEPQLDKNQCVFVEDYPPSQAALARIAESGWAERFEFYWQGMEIANAFHELNDPAVQRARAMADLREKERIGKAPVALDEEFFLTLENGFPPTSGIALGLDRLFMALTNSTNIEGHFLFPKRRQDSESAIL